MWVYLMTDGLPLMKKQQNSPGKWTLPINYTSTRGNRRAQTQLSSDPFHTMLTGLNQCHHCVEMAHTMDSTERVEV